MTKYFGEVSAPGTNLALPVTIPTQGPFYSVSWKRDNQ
jgi:hypothetical protein